MSAQDIVAYLDGLGATARAASIAEESYRRDVAQWIKELENRRAFAWRRLNLMRAVSAAVTGAKDENEAAEFGAAAMLREVGWNGATQTQRDVAERFRPVSLAVFAAAREEGGADAAQSAAAALETFESWFAEQRNAAFLTLMEREIVETPLVEV